jgi:hypothetical protein
MEEMEGMGELLRDAANTACGGTPKPRQAATLNHQLSTFLLANVLCVPSRPLRLGGSLFDEEKPG